VTIDGISATPMRKRILVVEDHDDTRTILVTLLRRFCGYETIEAANGTEAIEKAVAEKPDLILMDLDLPDISGIEAAKALKENPDTAYIPIVAQTAWSYQQWKEKVRRVGIVGYLEKPVSVELMKETIERFILPQRPNLFSQRPAKSDIAIN
jgi:two-component system, cell cycle response regulator DivK